MKNIIKISVIAIVAFIIQSCEPKTNESNAQESESSKIEESETLRQSEKNRALLDKRRADLKEQRRIAYQELILATPYYTNEEGIVVYNKAEVEPAYIGGKKAMEKYLSKNLDYPSDAEDEGLEGTVYVDFMIASDGHVSNVVASNSTWENVDEQFNTEAVRVVSKMPSWTPGTQHGKAVNVTYSLPITFRIN